MSDDLKKLREGDAVWFRRRENGHLLLNGRWLSGTVEKDEFYGDMAAVYENDLLVLLSDIRRRGPSPELVAECRRTMDKNPNHAPELKRLLGKVLESLEPPPSEE
jgi:hypothetical protein